MLINRGKGICALALAIGAGGAGVGLATFGPAAASGHGDGWGPGHGQGHAYGHAHAALGVGHAYGHSHSQAGGGWSGSQGNDGPGNGNGHAYGRGNGNGNGNGHAWGRGGNSPAPVPTPAPAPAPQKPAAQPTPAPRPPASHGNGQGNGNGHAYGRGNGNGHAYGHSSPSIQTVTGSGQGNGNGNGHAYGRGNGQATYVTHTSQGVGCSSGCSITPQALGSGQSSPGTTVIPTAGNTIQTLLPTSTVPTTPTSNPGTTGVGTAGSGSGGSGGGHTVGLGGPTTTLTGGGLLGSRTTTPTVTATPFGLALTLPGGIITGTRTTPLATGTGFLGAATPAGTTGARTTTTAGTTRPGGRQTLPARPGSSPSVIQRIERVVPGYVWIALAASLLLAAVGGTATLLAGRRVRRHAGQFAAVSAAAMTDPLTGVLNRRGFLEALERELARARRYGLLFTLAYVDVRGLKRVNDSEGHLAGDELLKGAAALLKESARADDVVGRIGGDEMGLLLVEQGAEGAGTVIRRITSQVPARREELGINTPWDLTVGTASFPEDGGTVNELLATADRRLYEQRGIALR